MEVSQFIASVLLPCVLVRLICVLVLRFVAGVLAC